jgi:hypothetical protein
MFLLEYYTTMDMSHEYKVWTPFWPSSIIIPYFLRLYSISGKATIL